METEKGLTGTKTTESGNVGGTYAGESKTEERMWDTASKDRSFHRETE